MFWLGSDRPSGFFLRARYTSFHTFTLLFLYLLPLCLCLLWFILFPYASVWENNLAWVARFLLPYWMVLALVALWKQWKLETERKEFENVATKIVWVNSILITKSINLQVFTLILYCVVVLCDRRRFSVLSPFIEQSIFYSNDRQLPRT